MTNEQREAIEYLKESVLIYKNTIPKISDAIYTVLSLIKEQEEEIAKYEKIYKEYDCYRWVKELNKKDKQIDLMAQCIDKELSSARLGELLNKNVNPLETYKEDIKQYFERKVEDVKD